MAEKFVYADKQLTISNPLSDEDDAILADFINDNEKEVDVPSDDAAPVRNNKQNLMTFLKI